MVPDLLDNHVLALWRTRGTGIRVLRLVCKEMGSVAMQGVTSCSLELGMGAMPASTQKFAVLLSRGHLKRLSCTVITYPGESFKYSIRWGLAM